MLILVWDVEVLLSCSLVYCIVVTLPSFGYTKEFTISMVIDLSAPNFDVRTRYPEQLCWPSPCGISSSLPCHASLHYKAHYSTTLPVSEPCSQSYFIPIPFSYVVFGSRTVASFIG